MASSPLLSKLKEYERLMDAAKVTAHAQAKLKAEIEKLVASDPQVVNGLKVGDYAIKLISPIRSKLDKKKFVELGGSLETLEKATVQTPTKSYIKITCPGESVTEETYES